MAQPRKIKTKLMNVNDYGESVYSLEFKIDKKYAKFIPGQFLHFTLDDFDPTEGFWPESRVFSIASEPKKEKLVIVYSVKGAYTRRMEKELKAGKEYWLKLPYGDFSIEKNLESKQEAVLIAGGTGISPFIPYLIDKNKLTPNRLVRLYYGCRSFKNYLFKDELKQARKIMPNLNVKVYIENKKIDGFQYGKLDIQNIIDETNDLTNPSYFISGPPIMIKSFKAALLDAGRAKENIIIDEWE